MRQILYISSSNPRGTRIDVAPILKQSQRNNGIDGVTGLLYTDGQRFLQVLEGPDESVATTFERIRGDDRHHAIVILSDRAIGAREFGDWAMAYRDITDAEDAFDERMRRLLAGTSDSIRGIFEGLVAARRLVS